MSTETNNIPERKEGSELVRSYVSQLRIDRWWYYNQSYRVWGNQSPPSGFLGIPTYDSSYQEAVSARFKLKTMIDQDPSILPVAIDGLVDQVALVKTEKIPENSNDENVSSPDIQETENLIEELILEIGPEALPYLEKHKDEQFARKMTRKIKLNENL